MINVSLDTRGMCLESYDIFDGDEKSMRVIESNHQSTNEMPMSVKAIYH